VLLMPGILPEIDTAGGVVYRDASGNPLLPPEVYNAYSPSAAFLSNCLLTALPENCDGRIEARQINAIVSEMLALAECFDPDGPWDCTKLTNLCTAFNAWVAAHCVYVDNVSIVGAGTQANPYRVNLIDCGTY